jgi:tight adherence protein C
MPLAYGYYLYRAGEPLNPTQIGILMGLFFVGFRLPDWWLDHQIGSRQKEIQRALPDALDLIVICIEAGLSFNAALARVTDQTRGALAEEVRKALHEMSLGKRRQDALRDMATRTGASDLVSFIAAVIQADRTGVSIGQVLRVQADALRVRRRQRAQEEGMQAPLKMLVPLIFFIFPATFVVLIGPALLSILDVLRQR